MDQHRAGNEVDIETIVVLDDLDQVLETIDNLIPNVEAAVEALESFDDPSHHHEDDDQPTVIVRTDDTETTHSVTKRELTNPIMQAMMENQTELSGPVPPMTRPEFTTTAKPNMMSDIQRKVSYSQRNNTTDQDAAISASLYMNPATEKIASNLIVTWEPAVAEIIGRLSQVSNPQRPFLVGLVGIPGSGKSTSAEIVLELLGPERAMVMPMDGFHLELSRLAEAPNAKDLIYRRGAPDTFDPNALRDTLHEIAYGNQEMIHIPGFDHAMGDPLPDQHTFVRSKNEIVLVEGLYLLHDDHGWETIKSVFDWTIYIDANVDDCIERLKIRNKCIPVCNYHTNTSCHSQYYIRATRLKKLKHDATLWIVRMPNSPGTVHKNTPVKLLHPAPRKVLISLIELHSECTV